MAFTALRWRSGRSACIVVTTLSLACADSSRQAPTAPPPGGVPVQGTGAANPIQATAPAQSSGGGEWVMAPGDYASTRFSPLTDINSANVAQLREAWSFSTGVLAGHEGAPLVVNGTMFLVSPFPNAVFALDLTQPGAPLKWRYDPDPQGAARGVACCDVVNRGAAYDNGRLFFNTLDGYAIALDAATGTAVWRTKVGEINNGETITMAPMVVKGKVLVGNSGAEFGVRGWLLALDALTGTVVWKAYSTGPDRDVLIGPSFKPFYEMDRGVDLGTKTWPSEAWKIGGGTVWGWISYDPELDLVFYGTGNPGPWNPDQRPGDNKWTSGIFARNPDTGEARWFYQWSPHDLYDYDGVNENVLLTLTVGGQERRVLVRPERNGYVYVLDRATGEVVSATPFVHITSSHGVDLRTGRLQYNDQKRTQAGVVVRDICPAAPGAKDWNPSSFSPRTGLLYIPHNNLCMDFESMEVNYIAGTPYVGADVMFKAGPGGHRGVVTAWDPAAGRAAWTIRERFMAWSGTLATAGDVVFYGTMDGWFKAVDARSGQLLWQHKTSSGIIGQPVTYRGPDGKQYLAIFSGVGGWPGSIVVNELDTRDKTAGLGWGSVIPDLPSVTGKGGVLHVFSLP
jgi:PQQ-dependent dehydrogenase (methanol/ethanol family)